MKNLFIFIFFVPFISYSQGRAITGQVLDAIDKNPVGIVDVSVVGKGLTTTTDDEGAFYMRLPEKISNGEVLTLRFIKNGYKPATRQITVSSLIIQQKLFKVDIFASTTRTKKSDHPKRYEENAFKKYPPIQKDTSTIIFRDKFIIKHDTIYKQRDTLYRVDTVYRTDTVFERNNRILRRYYNLGELGSVSGFQDPFTGFSIGVVNWYVNNSLDVNVRVPGDLKNKQETKVTVGQAWTFRHLSHDYIATIVYIYANNFLCQVQIIQTD